MKISSLLYCLKEGLKNIVRNLWFSLASIATIASCVFLFCTLFSLVANVQHMAYQAGTTVGITVFFDETMAEEDILAIGETIKARPEVKEANYISAEAAWEDFQKEYFKDMEDLAEGFAEDNPLAGSSNYEIFLYDLEDQPKMVQFLESIPEIRKVNYSNDTVAGLQSFNKMLGLLSIVLISILLAVSVFLIHNTISTAAAFRKEENRIMRLIGATNFMIRAPFVVEGMVLGFFGALIPLVVVMILYRDAVRYLLERFQILSNIVDFLPIQTLFPYLAGVSMLLGVGIGFVGSFFTIRKHLKV